LSNILSQSEIDNLLNALNAGTDVSLEDESKDSDSSVRPYDFRTANKFYKEQMRTLNIVFDTYAYLLSTKLTGLLHTMCEVDVVSVEEQSFGEFNNSLSSPVLLAILEMPPLQGSILIQISPVLAYGIISRLFGGAADYTLSNKLFTEIEMSIIENLLVQTLDIFRESFKKIIEVDPELIRIETSSQFTQIAAMNEPAAIVTMNTKIDGTQGMLSICIPHFSIQSISKELNTASWSLASNVVQFAPDKKDTLKEHLDETYVTLRATFNDTTTTLNEILNMQVGDLIRIDHSIDEYIRVHVEHIPKFEGVIGVEKQKYAVQLANIIKETVESE
jgi:flagellar motor switch protein FliM